MLLARARLEKYQNVDLREVDSVIALRALTQKLTDRAAPTLFYLDAHRQEQLPLREESELALAHFPKAVLMIDDFEVPDDPGYGFDDYGPGKRLCLAYLQQAKSAAGLCLFSGDALAAGDWRAPRLRGDYSRRRACRHPRHHRAIAPLEDISNLRLGHSAWDLGLVLVVQQF